MKRTDALDGLVVVRAAPGSVRGEYSTSPRAYLSGGITMQHSDSLELDRLYLTSCGMSQADLIIARKRDVIQISRTSPEGAAPSAVFGPLRFYRQRCSQTVAA